MEEAAFQSGKQSWHHHQKGSKAQTTIVPPPKSSMVPSRSQERRRKEMKGQQKENSAHFISHNAVSSPSNAPNRNASVDKTGIRLYYDWFPSSVNPGGEDS